MDWSYLAGFFDGEGTIRMRTGNRGVHWSVGQSGERGRLLLQELRDFLFGAGIRSALTPAPHEMWVLWITETDDIERLGRFLIPRLKIKRTEFVDVLRYRKLYPRIVHGPLLGALIRDGKRRAKSAS